MKEKKITRMLWHEFSQEELQQRGLDLSAAVEDLEECEEAKADAAKEFGEQMKDIRGKIRALSRAISARGEQQQTECIVHFHKPKVAEKEIYRADTGELLGAEAMTPEECQEHLFESGATG